uniref:RNA polymerase sigma factor n=1 Tax=Actinoplanes sp. CA-084688 TaxID=3239901 RepID=UPI003F499460
MEEQAIPDADGSSDSGATTTSSDLQRSEQADLVEEQADLADPSTSYEKDLRDGALVDPPAASTSRPIPTQAGGPRRVEDEALVNYLAQREFCGPEYDAFKDRLVRYGFGVCLGWIKSGMMHKQCKDRGMGLPPFPEAFELQDYRDLATDTVVDGFDLFRRIALVGRKWDAGRGASLTTYYIGACVRAFPNAYRRSCKVFFPVGFDLSDQIIEFAGGGVDDRVHNRELLARIKNGLMPGEWTALSMRHEGHTYAEIAAVLGVTEKAVDGLVQRGSAKARKIRDQWGGQHD